MLQGLAYFPGVNQVIQAQMGFVHGVSPSVATLTIVPQANFIAQGGTLRFTFGNVLVQFPDCRVNYNSLVRNEAGEVWRLSIFDRRWKWTPWGGGGRISGNYNQRMPTSLIKNGTEKTPRELAILCLKAMGESGYDVGELPNDSRPEVHWDYALPAEALARLCDDLGCRVVLGLNNRVKICQAGKGLKLPLDGVMENSLTIDPPEKPQKLAIVTGPVRYQADFELEAVGVDRGTDIAKWPAEDIRPIDELSYKPTGGFGGTTPPFFGTELKERAVRELAQATVFKYYRVKCSAKNPITIPGYAKKITSLDQINFLNEQNATGLMQAFDNLKVELPPMVYGVWCDGRYGLDNINATVNPNVMPTELNNDRTFRDFAWDAASGTVKFSEPIYYNANAAKAKLDLAPAKLRIRVACTINDPDTRAMVRYERERRTGSKTPTPTRYVRHDEITPTVTPEYDKNFGVKKIIKNDKAIDRECDHYLDAAMRDYELKLPQTITYSGLRKIDLDGAIQQVTFTVGTDSGAMTTASRNTEQIHFVLPYKERRLREQQREMRAATGGNIITAVGNVMAWIKKKVGR